MNTPTTTRKISLAEVMTNQDIMDKLLTEYHRADTTEARRAEIAEEYRGRETENTEFFEARRKK